MDFYAKLKHSTHSNNTRQYQQQPQQQHDKSQYNAISPRQHKHRDRNKETHKLEHTNNSNRNKEPAEIPSAVQRVFHGALASAEIEAGEPARGAKTK